VIPWPLAGAGAGPYLALYVVTLALHAALIGYVLGGAGYALIAAARRRPDPIAAAARDWLPFFLGAAITAGVAPLLFVQLLYQERFYTADLLLGPRWLAIVPALIVGFYALYVHKAAAADRPRRRLVSIAVAVVCFAFVAWSWTEHHLVMLDDARWHDFYQAGRRIYTSDAVGPRLALWLMSSAPLFASIAAWQIGDDVQARRRLAAIALIGIAASTALALVVRAQLDPAARAGIEAATPWLAALVIGRVAEAAAWIAVLLGRPARIAIAVATAGAAASLVAGVVLREAARVHVLAPARPGAVSAGGAPVFVIALLVVTAAIVWIARLVRPRPPG
jgi:hypothetical protein